MQLSGKTAKMPSESLIDILKYNLLLHISTNFVPFSPKLFRIEKEIPR